MDKSLEDLVNTIFSGTPKPPCTYNIALSETSSDTTTMFQLLMGLLISGARYLYGETVTPNDISPNQFEELKRYMESVGYQIKHNYKTVGEDDPNLPDELKPRMINIWFEQYIPFIDCHGRRRLL
jgi:hypothetical protein